MKSLKFYLSHPFKGHALIKKLGAGNALYKNSFADSKESSLIETPLNDFRNGKYEVMLDRETDNRFFAHQRNFKIIDRLTFTAAIS